MKRVMSAIVAAALISGSLTIAAWAATKEAPAYTADQMKRGAKDAPDAIQAAGLKCTPKSVAWLGEGDMEDKATKKKVKAQDYEVACDDGTGWIVIKPAAGQAVAYDCLDMQALYDSQVAAKKPGGPRCKLPENLNLAAQVQPLVAKAGLKCSANNVNKIGASTTTHQTFYEVGCAEGGGWVLARQDTTGEVAPDTCLHAAVSYKYSCKFSPKAAQVAQIGSMATAIDSACQVSDARYVATTVDHHDLYEIGCSGGHPGFFLDAKGVQPVRSIDCVSAANIAGGCTMTDLKIAKQSAGSKFGNALKAHGVACSTDDYRAIGADAATNRDIVEFKCPERPTGLMALIPLGTAKGKFETYDCITVAPLKLECKLTSKAEILAAFKSVLAGVGKPCDPTEYRLVGPGEQADSDLIEIKCSAGQSGYLVDVPPTRSKTHKTLTCAQASRPGNYDHCEIPGNS